VIVLFEKLEVEFDRVLAGEDAFQFDVNGFGIVLKSN
jgi:hypothetical protein